MGTCGNTLTDSIRIDNISKVTKSENISEDISLHTFKKIKYLGKGSNADVFLIQSDKTKELYALKLIAIKNMEEKMIDLVMREVNNLKDLDHQNIISFKIAFKSDENTKLNIITEYADSGDLNQKLKKQLQQKKYFEEKLLLDWLFQSCLALEYIHNKNIIHRDIKPSNILLNNNNIIKLSDFGVSKNISIFKSTKTLIGTPLYLAPEILKVKEEKKPYSFKADIWSLGVTFCHLMSLEFPFEGKGNENVYDNIKKGNKNKKILNENNNNYNENISKHFSKEFRDLIDEMMTIEPEKRPSAEEILKKDIIKNRMISFYNENKNNFDYYEAEKFIEKYKFENENNETSKKNIKDIKIDDSDDLNKTEEMTPVKPEKIKYDYLRQMSFLHVQIKRIKTNV